MKAKRVCWVCNTREKHCTNGLCYECHAAHCTQGGETAPGHNVRRADMQVALALQAERGAAKPIPEV